MAEGKQSCPCHPEGAEGHPQCENNRNHPKKQEDHAYNGFMPLHLFPPGISEFRCRFQISPRSHAGAWERDKTKDDCLNQSIPNVRFGSHKAKSGQKMTNRTTTTTDNINSQPSLTKSQSEHLNIVQTIKRTAPSGGVNNPMVRVSTIMIPKCTRSIFSC